MGTGNAKCKKLIGKEVFVFCSEEGQWTEVFITEEWARLCDFMRKRLVPDMEVKVYYGVLADATCIPTDREGVTTYIVVASPDDDDRGCCFEADDTDPEGDIATAIEEMLADDSALATLCIEDLDINDVFLLFGGELSLYAAPNSDDIDDVMLENANALYRKISKIKDKEIDGGE